MIIFLYGPDDYRRAQKKKEIIAEFEKKYSNLGVGLFDLSLPETADSLGEFLRSQSIFESKKLAIVENLFPVRKSAGDGDHGEDPTEDAKGKNKGASILFKKYLDSKSATILIAESKKPTKEFSFLLKAPVLFQEFEALMGSAWESFIKTEAKKQGVDLSLSSVRFLAAVFQGDSWALATELQRLSSYQRTIDITDLNELDIAPNYWALMNGVKSFDIRARLGALERLLGTSDHAPKLFNILASQWREKTAQMATYDRAIKSGKLEYEEALVELVLG